MPYLELMLDRYNFLTYGIKVFGKLNIIVYKLN